MTLSHTQGALKRFRRTPWKLQQTFHTPLKKLRPFVATILAVGSPIETACDTIDEVIFEPKHLIATMAKHSLPPTYGRDWTLKATGRQEVEELLEATLSDWINFILSQRPGRSRSMGTTMSTPLFTPTRGPN